MRGQGGRVSEVELGQRVSTTRVPGGGDRAIRRSASYFMLVLLAAAAAYAMLILVAMATTNFNGRPLDFSVYYAASAALHDNPHANIYDASVLAGCVSAHPGCVLWRGAAYPYPPLLAILMEPLAAMPYDAAVHAWMLINLALWAIGTALLAFWLRLLLSRGGADASAQVGADRRQWLARLLRGEADSVTVSTICVITLSIMAWPVLQGLLM